jgi:predicted nucleotidyltransferase
VTDPREPTRLLVALRQIAAALDQRAVPWALVGGLAVSIRVEPRFTRDIDVAVAVEDDAAAETLIADLTAAGFALLLTLEQRALGRLATVRLLPPGEPLEGVVVDLLFSSSGIEPEICRDAQPIEVVPGLTVRVAQAGHLVAMKILALAPDRPQDAIDLNGLISSLNDADRILARAATERIEALGANRGKPLRDELERRLKGGSCPPPTAV